MPVRPVGMHARSRGAGGQRGPRAAMGRSSRPPVRPHALPATARLHSQPWHRHALARSPSGTNGSRLCPDSPFSPLFPQAGDTREKQFHSPAARGEPLGPPPPSKPLAGVAARSSRRGEAPSQRPRLPAHPEKADSQSRRPDPHPRMGPLDVLHQYGVVTPGGEEEEEGDPVRRATLAQRPEVCPAEPPLEHSWLYPTARLPSTASVARGSPSAADEPQPQPPGTETTNEQRPPPKAFVHLQRSNQLNFINRKIVWRDLGQGRNGSLGWRRPGRAPLHSWWGKERRRAGRGSKRPCRQPSSRARGCGEERGAAHAPTSASWRRAPQEHVPGRLGHRWVRRRSVVQRRTRAGLTGKRSEGRAVTQGPAFEILTRRSREMKEKESLGTYLKKGSRREDSCWLPPPPWGPAAKAASEQFNTFTED